MPVAAREPEVFLSDNATKAKTSASLAAGKIRKIGPRLYTRNLRDPIERIVSRHVWDIVAMYCPGALITGRTALENRPAEDGSVFVISDRTADVEVPGLRIRSGVGPLATDRTFMGNLYLASPGRAVLENLVPSRARGGVSRSVSRRAVEAHLEQVLARSGAAKLNEIRDQARDAAPRLGLEDQFKQLDGIIGALLGTRLAESITDPSARARVAGLPYDPRRLEAFEALRAELASRAPVVRLFGEPGNDAPDNVAFFEAYFSNFIEGTEFEVDEAYDIVFNNVIPEERPRDAHDVLGTFRVVADASEMMRLPGDAAELEALLKSRHATIMSSRPDKGPGRFKRLGNQAGGHIFVAPDLVRGTLARGMDFYLSLDDPFARAAFIMYLVSEVHPFEDGNGRVARVMMNADLVAQGQHRIIIPAVFRNEYLDGLRALSQNGNTRPFASILDFAHRYTSAIPWARYGAARQVLQETNAFLRPREAEANDLRLRLPTAEILLRAEADGDGAGGGMSGGPK